MCPATQLLFPRQEMTDGFFRIASTFVIDGNPKIRGHASTVYLPFRFNSTVPGRKRRFHRPCNCRGADTLAQESEKMADQPGPRTRSGSRSQLPRHSWNARNRSPRGAYSRAIARAITSSSKEQAVLRNKGLYFCGPGPTGSPLRRDFTKGVSVPRNAIRGSFQRCVMPIPRLAISIFCSVAYRRRFRH